MAEDFAAVARGLLAAGLAVLPLAAAAVLRVAAVLVDAAALEVVPFDPVDELREACVDFVARAVFAAAFFGAEADPAAPRRGFCAAAFSPLPVLFGVSLLAMPN
ncbi:hypothetical protein [Paracoccus albus]|uniref:hypothetical protein n=1 Tax=Paracoccus albus TaxID=3017784 RepID=UPI0022F0369E|nr:hypothetical protein [Paracoccus albus]WBU61172.1 hypothetical protein PAF20_04460 [Paracoccus albus]